MKPFLQRLAEEIATRYGDDPGQVCVVLPNRRAGLYLKKYLAAALNKTAWSPETSSIEDFITNLSGYNIIDQAGLLFEFYQVHREIHKEKAQDFETFADWGQVLLKDFDEVDQYLVDPQKIFTYLNAARALTVWNLNENPLTDQEKSYIEFYQSFLTYYQLLQKNLTKRKQAYQGLAYRFTAENIQEKSAGLKWKKIFFAGLNALSTAEEKIIEYLVRSNKAEVFWDADAYYIEDNKQEAGDFIREYLKEWPTDPVKWIENDFRLTEKVIHVYGIPGSSGQAQKAGQIISTLKSADEAPDKTALVLADEKLLLPVLYELPEGYGPVNVTMGYPFKYTHLYQLVSLLFQLQENAEKFAGQRKLEKRSFYVKDLLKLLAHPYLSLFLPSDKTIQASFDKTAEIIRNKNRVFIMPGELLKYSSGAENEYSLFCERLYKTWDGPDKALEGLIGILEMIRDRVIAESQVPGTDFDLDLEYLYHLSKILKRCRTLLTTYPSISTLKTLRKILFQLLDSSRLPFSGEPLQGLQVMGVLETRAIDFENLVVLSVNEGILPSGRLPNSFIPFDIKSEFGLPTYRHKDAVFAYHFYHMLQRAKKIFLLYDTEGDQMKGGEKSRFITQIGYELTKVNPGIIFEERLLRPEPPGSVGVTRIRITKSPSMMARLAEKSEKGFSPTALNLYIKCSLWFYFQEILGLYEAETVEETIEARTMGTAIHQVLQKVYEPYEGKYVNSSQLSGKIDQLEDHLLAAFREHYNEGDLEYGKNHLIYKVSSFLVNQFIRNEAELLKSSNNDGATLQIIFLEKNFKQPIACNIAGEQIQVNIKGKTDRIDRWEDVTRIIDYKTGIVQPFELNLKSWESLVKDPKMAKAFQLLLYAWLYFKNIGKPGEKIQTGNFTLRKISAGFMRVKLPEGKEVDSESMGIFEEMLKNLLEDILDPSIPFVQTEEEKNCQNCPFTAICTR